MFVVTLVSFRALTLAVALAAVPFSAALASEEVQVLGVVNQFSEDFSKNDMKAAIPLCSDQVVIIDDFAPHTWQGATACADWWTAFVADNEKSGIAGGIVKLGKPWHVSITGDHAYVAYPLTYTFKHNGTQTISQGVWTFALQKLAGSWRIAGLAFALRDRHWPTVAGDGY